MYSGKKAFVGYRLKHFLIKYPYCLILLLLLIRRGLKIQAICVLMRVLKKLRCTFYISARYLLMKSDDTKFLNIYNKSSLIFQHSYEVLQFYRTYKRFILTKYLCKFAFLKNLQLFNKKKLVFLIVTFFFKNKIFFKKGLMNNKYVHIYFKIYYYILNNNNSHILKQFFICEKQIYYILTYLNFLYIEIFEINKAVNWKVHMKILRNFVGNRSKLFLRENSGISGISLKNLFTSNKIVVQSNLLPSSEEILESIFNTYKPTLGIMRKKVAGRVIILPTRIHNILSKFILIKWFIKAVNERSESSLSDRLYNECVDLSAGIGRTVKLIEEYYLLIYKNLPYLKYLTELRRVQKARFKKFGRFY